MVILDTDVNGKEINITQTYEYLWQVQVKLSDMSKEHVKTKNKVVSVYPDRLGFEKSEGRLSLPSCHLKSEKALNPNEGIKIVK